MTMGERGKAAIFLDMGQKPKAVCGEPHGGEIGQRNTLPVRNERQRNTLPVRKDDAFWKDLRQRSQSFPPMMEAAWRNMTGLNDLINTPPPKKVLKFGSSFALEFFQPAWSPSEAETPLFKVEILLKNGDFFFAPFFVAFSREALKPPRKGVFHERSFNRRIYSPQQGRPGWRTDFQSANPRFSQRPVFSCTWLDGKWYYIRAGIPVTHLATPKKTVGKNTRLKETGVFFDWCHKKRMLKNKTPSFVKSISSFLKHRKDPTWTHL